MPSERRSGRRVWFWVVGVGLAALVAVAAWLGPAVADFYRAGFFERVETREYDPEVETNLLAIHRALMLYVESEGALPPAESWMDAAWIRLQTRDMEKEEAKKKLVNPNVARGPDQYGFAFNADLAGKHPEDVAESTALVYETDDPAWNATTPPRPNGASVSVGGVVDGGEVAAGP